MAMTAPEMYEALRQIPLLDAHTHIHAAHISARGLDDILLYHMVISELYAAGCPDGARLSDDPSEAEREARIERALPYLPHIRNTSCYWGVRMILEELYGWDAPITKHNWRELDARIAAKSKDHDWPREIMRRARISRSVTELWRGCDGLAEDIFQYSLEWAFFTRNQWGQFDTALVELEHAWNQDTPGAPLPVTTDRASLRFEKSIRTMEDVEAAVEHYCARIPADRVLSIASHLSTDLAFRAVSESEMAEALRSREAAGARERDIYANYIHGLYLTRMEAMGTKLVLQYSMGAEPLPFETGSKLRTDTVFELAQLFARHGGLRFNLFNANFHQQQAINTLVRELPNVSVSAYWWHNFFPQYVRETFAARLDMLPLNKHVGFFSDAYCMDWAYAKAAIIRMQMAQVLAEKVAQRQYDRDTALSIARALVYETPRTLLGIAPAPSQPPV